MTQVRPVVYLLVGLPGSGKTTFAKQLEHGGVTRLSVDEAIISRYGRLGVDYQPEQHFEHLSIVVSELEQKLITLLQMGSSVVFDHGLGQKVERDHFKWVVERHGGTWRLLHFQVPLPELKRRLKNRQERAEGQAFVIGSSMLDHIAAHSEEPLDEGQETVGTRTGVG